MCANLPDLANGTVVYSPDTNFPFEFMTVATYVCDSGFGLIGTETRTCDHDDSSPNGKWTGMAAFCDGKENACSLITQLNTIIRLKY